MLSEWQLRSRVWCIGRLVSVAHHICGLCWGSMGSGTIDLIQTAICVKLEPLRTVVLELFKESCGYEIPPGSKMLFYMAIVNSSLKGVIWPHCAVQRAGQAAPRLGHPGADPWPSRCRPLPWRENPYLDRSLP
ncbi:PREDICTED: bolA-like protein 1 [Odobenus rosmarus divergens]|uniref:BolA-like protein 1 n=1 Tax=Odobenus rosmarus divergens TaxID=9708 RepID=A0A2U3X514_ODORO|nr:PREDICTED: bolA-like protein 1 [Odobenus rosmarus divergens]